MGKGSLVIIAPLVVMHAKGGPEFGMPQRCRRISLGARVV
jgi:hypothetical protein